MPASAQQRLYTIDDIYTLPDGERAELIDGQIYYMAPPNRKHQTIARELFTSINSYIKSNNGACEPFFAPFAVFFNKDDINYVEPDICVICDRNKLTDKGCSGAPDWIIEIVSPSNRPMDYYTKLFKYRSAGVREYWIVDHERSLVILYQPFNPKYIKAAFFNSINTLSRKICTLSEPAPMQNCSDVTKMCDIKI